MVKPRRTYGTGSIYFEESRQRWCAEGHVADPYTGRKKSIKTRHGTRREAELALQERMAMDARPDRGTTFGALVDHYREKMLTRRVQSGEITASTAASAEAHIAHLLRVIGEDTALSTLDNTDYLDKVKYLLDDPINGERLARSYQQRVIKRLREIIDVAVARGLLSTNRARLLKPLPVPEQQHQTLNSNQVATLLTTVQGQWDEPYYLLAATWGLRVGEALGVTWDRVYLDGDKPHVVVDRQLTGSHGDLRLVKLKNRREGEGRTIPLTDYQVERLRTIRRDRVRTSMDYGGWADDVRYDSVVVSPAGRPPAQHTVSKRLSSLCDRLGLPRVTTHDLRRTSASILLSQGVDIPTVREIGGWRDTATLLRVYAHVTETGVDRARSVIDGLLPAG